MSSGRTTQGGRGTGGPAGSEAREGGPGLAPAPDITPEGLTAALAQADDAAFAAEFAAEIAAQARGFVDGIGEIAAGGAPDTAIAELLVLLAQVNLAGAMLGAVADVVPQAKFEPDAGLDPDADPLREGLASLLEGLDDYAYVFDPLLPEQPTTGRVSDDVADICLRPRPRAAPLRRGRHRRGPVVVAVLVPVHLGRPRAVCAARAAVGGGPPAAGRRRDRRAGRRGRRAAVRLTGAGTPGVLSRYPGRAIRGTDRG